MFATLFSSTLNKIFIGLLLLLFFVLAVVYIGKLNKEQELTRVSAYSNSQKAELEEQQATIDQQQNTIKNLKKIAEVNQQAVSQAHQETVELSKKVDAVNASTEKKVVVIRNKYIRLPSTPDNNKSEDDEISFTRISGLHDVYCQSITGPLLLDCPAQAEAALVAPAYPAASSAR